VKAAGKLLCFYISARKLLNKFDDFEVEPCAAPVAPPPPKFSIGVPNAAAAEIFGQRRRKSAARLKMRPSPKNSQ